MLKILKAAESAGPASLTAPKADRLRWRLAVCFAWFMGFGLIACARAGRADDGLEAERYYYFIRSAYEELNRDDDAALEHMIKAASLGEGSYRLKLEAARLYSRTGDNRNALKYAREALELKPEEPAARLLSAWLAGADDDPETAEREYLKVLELYPDNDEALYWLGVIYYDARRYAEAEKFFRRLARVKPAAASYYHLGHLYRGLGRTGEAVKALTTALNKEPDFAAALEELAHIYEAAGRLGPAEKTYRRLIDLAESRAQAVQSKNGLTRVLLKAGRRREAEKLTADLILEERSFRHGAAPSDEEADDDSDDLEAGVRLRLGFIYSEQNLYREAVREFEALLKLRPDNDRARYFLASTLLERPAGKNAAADRARAARLLEAVGPSSPLFVDARLLLTAALNSLDEKDSLEKSLALLEEAERTKPDSYRLKLARSIILERLGELEKARAVLLKAAESFPPEAAGRRRRAETGALARRPGKEAYFPREADVLYRIGALEDQLDHKASALDYMRQTLNLHPAHADALNYMAYSWAERRENLEEALTMAKKADALKPGQGYIMDTVAWIYYQMGQPGKALPFLKRAALTSRDPVVLDHLGDVLSALERGQEALEAYRQALEGGFADQEELNEKIRKISK